jgi:hypothetical protein
VWLRLLWPGWLRFPIKIDPAPPKLPATRLSEDLVHYLGSLSERRADLMPVHKFGCGRAVVSGQQRDALCRHSVRRQHRHECVPHLPRHPVLPEPGDTSDDSERPDHVVRTQRRADSRREYQAMVLPQLPRPGPVICLLQPLPPNASTHRFGSAKVRRDLPVFVSPPWRSERKT